jgi:hypothetical protein
VGDREHKNRDLWVTLAVAVMGVGAAAALAIWAAELPQRHVGFWPHAGEVAGLALIVLGTLLVVAIVRGWWLPGGFTKQAGTAAPVEIDPALWNATVAESGDHRSMIFQLEHRFSERLTVQAFTQLRVTVIDPSQITTTAEGLGRIYQYPAQFQAAPAVRSGIYHFKWEGRDDRGAWHGITEGDHEVAPLPALIVTIIDNKFENWHYIALLAAFHVQIENTTDADILVASYGFTCDYEGLQPWDHQASGDNIMCLRREIHRRQERQEYGPTLRNYARILAGTRISGWYLTAVTRNPRGGTPECVVVVTDDIGNEYRAVLAKQEPQIYHS